MEQVRVCYVVHYVKNVQVLRLIAQIVEMDYFWIRILVLIVKDCVKNVKIQQHHALIAMMEHIYRIILVCNAITLVKHVRLMLMVVWIVKKDIILTLLVNFAQLIVIHVQDLILQIVLLALMVII